MRRAVGDPPLRPASTIDAAERGTRERALHERAGLALDTIRHAKELRSPR